MIEIDIVTPTRRVLVGARVPSVRLPAANGELQVLPGHTELLALLGTGVLSFPQGEAERKFAVSYGFAEVRKDKVIVLAETCEEAADIDVARAKEAQKRAETALTGVMSLTAEQIEKQELKRQRALVRQKVAE